MPASDTAFVHQSLRTRVVARPGAIDSLAAELQALGCRRPLLLASNRIAAGAMYATLRQAMDGFSPVEAKDIPAHSSVATVARIAQAAREGGIDCLVAIGGGSVCDTAKAVALVLAEGGPLERHATRFVPPDKVVMPELLRAKLPIVAIPMSASGAEVTPSVGIRAEDGTKLLFWDRRLASSVVLLDPVANLAMPAAVMLTTGMNGLAHCIEGLYSKHRSPISTALALEGIRRFDQALVNVAREPGEWRHRAELLTAANISGMVLASARSCLHHAICHVLGASHGVAHGDVNAVILPHAVQFNSLFATNELAAAARCLGIAGSPSIAAEELITWLRSLQQKTGVPGRLRDLGIGRDSLRAAAEKVMHERGLAYNPRRVSNAEEVEGILTAAW